MSVLFVISRAPKEVYQLMKLFQASDFGYKGAGGPFGTPYGYYNFETDIILNALVYVVCAVHPILYFSFSQEYRQGLVNMWRNLDCNQSSAEVSFNGFLKVLFFNTKDLKHKCHNYNSVSFVNCDA